ncbi:MAG: radical SAM superfamily enzyme YgiQ (UPF0313 family) [Myxococcota bacterium]|jgi:radical SAM superfamily enzyme YgiQ (UPF0313 family)
MNKADLDCLLVHTPKADNHYLPFGDFFNITYMPMGLLAIAEQLRRRGSSVDLVHLGVEWVVDSAFNIATDTDGQTIRAIGLSLYWHYQSYDAIEVARALKAAHPEAFVFLGGLTAGYFAKQIVEQFPFIDAVVAGHAEGSAVRLVETLREGGDLGRIPGMIHRDADGNVVDNGKGPHLDWWSPALDDLVYGDMTVMRHPEIYADTFGFPLAYGREFSRRENQSMLTMARAFFPLFVGRGCPWMCTFCGGNRETLRKVNGSNKLQWRDPKAVLADVRRALDAGYKTMALCFDPTPQKDAYYVELFQLIASQNLDVDFYFECWGLPTPRFVREFRKAFPSPESYIAVSPDSGNDAVRKRNKQPLYTSADLFKTLQTFDDHEVKFDVFYTIALPGEVLETARDTQRQINHIAATYKHPRRLMTWSVQLEPGSPQFERPASFDMVTDRSNFLDFYRVHGGDRADTYSSLGYKIANYFGDGRDEGGIAEFERHLQHLKCMEFCFLGRDPRFWASPANGRQHCLERRQMLADRRGIQKPTRAIGPGYDYTDVLAEEKALRPTRERHSWV